MSLSDAEDPPPNVRSDRPTDPAPANGVEHLAELVLEKLLKKLEPTLKDISTKLDKVEAIDNVVGIALTGLEHVEEALRAQGQSLAENVVLTNRLLGVSQENANELLKLRMAVAQNHIDTIDQLDRTGRRFDGITTDHGARIVELEAYRRSAEGQDNGSIIDAVRIETGGE